MCNEIDDVVEVVLVKELIKKLRVIYYASHTLNEGVSYIIAEKFSGIVNRDACDLPILECSLNEQLFGSHVET